MPLNAKAEAVIQAFGKEPGVSHDQWKNLNDAINASPDIMAQNGMSLGASRSMVSRTASRNLRGQLAFPWDNVLEKSGN